VTVILDSTSILLAERADVLRQTVTESVVRVGIEFAPSDGRRVRSDE
jgi:hypothetical protein